MKIQNVLSNAVIAGIGGLAVSKVAQAAPADRFEMVKRAPAPAAVPNLAPAPAARSLAARSPVYSFHGTESYDSWAPCSSDWANYQITYNDHFDCSPTDAAGNQQCTYHYNAHGTATTYDTGVTYQITNLYNAHETFTYNPAYSFSEDINFESSATAPGSGKVLKGQELATFSYDTTNGFQITFKKYTYQCV